MVVEPRPFVAIVVIQEAASALVELFTSGTSLEWLLPAVVVVVIAVIVVVFGLTIGTTFVILVLVPVGTRTSSSSWSIVVIIVGAFKRLM